MTTARAIATRANAAALRLAIVMPVLDEAAAIATTLAALAPLRARGHRVIVVDGGSRDTTPALCRGLADEVISAPRGRASQMNAGAAAARAAAGLAARVAEPAAAAATATPAATADRSAVSDTKLVLLFLHADTQLPADADRLLLAAIRSGAGWGRFDVRITGRSPWLRAVAGLMNLRSRCTGIATGDQAIFVSAELFERVGGFPVQPLMEDVELSRRLRKRSRPACLHAKVSTSGRRWETRGVWPTILLMWRLRWRYWRGESPEALARDYR